MTPNDPQQPFERVYTVTEYYDAPRQGIANFRGKPHYFLCPFDSALDYFAELYELRAVDDETVRLALEAREIWLRWEDAYKRGLVGHDTHPALPAERNRYDEVRARVDARLAALAQEPPAARAKADFRPTAGQSSMAGGRYVEAQWIVVD